MKQLNFEQEQKKLRKVILRHYTIPLHRRIGNGLEKLGIFILMGLGIIMSPLILLAAMPLYLISIIFAKGRKSEQ